MKLVKTRCYNCGDKSPPPGCFFCSNKCARLYIEELLLGYAEGWCGVCRVWVEAERDSENDGCPKCRAPLQYPQRELYGRDWRP
jgi:hypothetical protein